ncbi:hypothetical protein SDJN03_23067, partial [Cucurbita argyrosperma subsp. sororia]
MGFKLCVQLFLLLALIAPHLASARNLQGSRKGDNRKGIHGVKAYLQRYGYYVTQNETNSQTNAFDEALHDSSSLTILGNEIGHALGLGHTDVTFYHFGSNVT